MAPSGLSRSPPVAWTPPVGRQHRNRGFRYGLAGQQKTHWVIEPDIDEVSASATEGLLESIVEFRHVVL